jgi:hypothetical protein
MTRTARFGVLPPFIERGERPEHVFREKAQEGVGITPEACARTEARLNRIDVQIRVESSLSTPSGCIVPSGAERLH